MRSEEVIPVSEIAARWVSVYPKIASGFSTEIKSAVAKGANQGGQALGVGMEQSVKSAAPKMSATFKSIVAPILTLKAIDAVAGFVRKSVDSFSELEDSTAAAAVIFGDSMDKIIAQSETAASTIGISKQQVIDAANTFGTYGKGAGLAGDALAKFSTDMTSLSADMASFKGKSPEEAIEAIGSALRGEAEPIRAFGVLLDDATLRAQAMKMGLIETTKDALTPQQKVLAAQAEIIRQTSDAHGDFARTADSTANTQKTLAAESANLSAEIGQKLAPAIVEAQKAGIGFLRFVTDNQAAIMPLVATVGTLTLAVGGFLAVSKGIEALKAARATVAGLGDAFQSMGTKAKIATASAGAIGIALAAASVVYGVFAQKNAEAQGRVEDLTEALRADNGVIGENTRATAANALQKAGALTLARQLGLSLSDVVSASLGEADAMTRVQAAIQAASEGHKNVANATEEQIAKHDAAATAAAELQRILGGSNAEIKQAIDAEKMHADAVGESTTATQASAAAVSGGKITFEEYTKAIKDTYNAQLQLRGGERAVEAAIDDAADAAKKNGKTLDINTKAGRDNQAALDGIANSALQVAAGMTDTEKANGKAADVMDRARGQFIETAKKMGLSSTAAKRLADDLGLIKSKKVTVEAEVKKTGISSIKVVAGKSSGTFVMIAKAGGGKIVGPGSGTSDDVLMAASNGEWVIREKSASYYGPQIMDAINQGKIPRSVFAGKFASGGPVMPSYKGHSLDWWQDKLLSDLEFTQLQIRIRDIQSDLKATETYNPPGKKKKATRQKLRGLDRAAAKLELTEAQEKLQLAKEAAEADASSSGTIADQLADYQERVDAGESAASAWRSAAESLGKGSGIQVGGAWKAMRDASGNTWYEGAKFSAADFVKKKTAEGDKAIEFVTKVDRLRQMGAPKGLTDDILALGYVDGLRVVEAFLADPSVLTGAASAYSRLDAARTQMGTISDAISASGGAQIQVTNYYPQAEPTSVSTNKALQLAAALGG